MTTPKPTKCDHDNGNHWLSYEENNLGVKMPLKWSKDISEICPFCTKPTEEEKIIYALSGFCIPPNVKKAIKQSLDYISAQRQAWEKEKAGFEERLSKLESPYEDLRFPTRERMRSEISRLEERVKELESGRLSIKIAKRRLKMPDNNILVRDILREHLSPILDQPQYDRLHSKFLNEFNLRDQEITRLKAENQAQTYKGNSIGYIYDKMIAYQTQVFPLSNALKELGFNYPESGKDNVAREKALIEWTHNKKEEISRLSASLAAAREALELANQMAMFDCPHESEQRCDCQSVGNKLQIKAWDALDKALSDPTGQAAHERWKRMWEVVTYANTVRNDILIPETDDQVEMSCQCKAWVDGLLERLQTLEALEAKGGADV